MKPLNVVLEFEDGLWARLNFDGSEEESCVLGHDLREISSASMRNCFDPYSRPTASREEMSRKVALFHDLHHASWSMLHELKQSMDHLNKLFTVKEAKSAVKHMYIARCF